LFHDDEEAAEKDERRKSQIIEDEMDLAAQLMNRTLYVT
jgi:hypothetical protein